MLCAFGTNSLSTQQKSIGLSTAKVVAKERKKKQMMWDTNIQPIRTSRRLDLSTCLLKTLLKEILRDVFVCANLCKSESQTVLTVLCC